VYKRQGLVTAIIGGFLISLLGGSRVQIGGPTGAFIVVVYGVIATHGYDGLVLATLMAGVILVLAGVFRAGSLIAHVPEPVISGFTIGIGIIIGASQLKDFMGLGIAKLPSEFLPKMTALWEARASLNSAALGVGLATILLIVALRKMAPRVPGLIVAVALTSALAALLPVDTIGARYGALPAALPMPSLPVFTIEKVIELLPSAVVIAFLAGVESLLSAIVADRMITGAHRPNAEVLAQGIANIGSALFGGLPATGAIARTATNIRAGGTTPVAGLVHAATILIVLLAFSDLAGRLAMPALAALLLVTSWNMMEPHRWRSFAALPKDDLALLIVTLVLTVLADLAIAIGTGVVLGLILRRVKGRQTAEDWTAPDR
jgi:SulP family sulfate permease